MQDTKYHTAPHFKLEQCPRVLTRSCSQGWVGSKLQSWNFRSFWNLEVYVREPRLESSYVSVCKLQPLYFVTCSYWRGLHCDWWKLCRARFCEVPPPKKGPSLTPKMAFDRCWKLQYWTLGLGVRPSPVMNDSYSGPPPARQEITLISDTLISYFILCHIRGAVVLLIAS